MLKNFFLPCTKEITHRIDEHCLLVTTGISGDGRALAKATRVACQRHRMNFGEAPSVREVAGMVADMQHDLTRTGGRRPFGITASIVGVDPVQAAEGDRIVRLFQSEPGGVLEEYSSCAAGGGRSKVDAELVAVRKRILQEHSLDENGVREMMVEDVSKILFDAHDGKASRLDIWMVSFDEKRRGRARIFCAKKVSREDLGLVKTLFREKE